MVVVALCAIVPFCVGQEMHVSEVSAVEMGRC